MGGAAHVVAMDDRRGHLFLVVVASIETTSMTMWLAATWATIRWTDSGRGTFLSLAAYRLPGG